MLRPGYCLFLIMVTCVLCRAQSGSPSRGNLELVLQTGHTNAVNTVAFSSDGRLLASGSADNTIIVWDVSRGNELLVLNAGSYVHSVVFSPDGSRLVSADGDSKVKVWDL